MMEVAAIRAAYAPLAKAFLRAVVLVLACGAVLVPLAHGQQASKGKAFDRDYVLEAYVTGYVGVGGEGAGVRNPVLRAKPGEKVRITIVGVEPIAHDIAMEKSGAKTSEVTRVGQRLSMTFTAKSDDSYYCTLPGHRAAGMQGKFEIIRDGQVAQTPAAARGMAVRSGARPMNLGFETGNLQDWIAEGDAFKPAAVLSSTAATDSVRHDGRHWVRSGGDLAKGYLAKGTLTSRPFTVTQPYASFRVAGGALKDTRVELVRTDGDSVFFEISGYGRATLRPVVVGLSAHMGKQIYIRLVDNETGRPAKVDGRDDPTAYIGFDAFQFFSTRPAYNNELKQADILILPPLDVVRHSGLSPKAALAAMELPAGFRIALGAAEPDVVRPIAFTMDDRGRLWVAEGNTYPVRAPEGQGKDRILIMEDTDGDGSLDKRKVFMEGLNLVSGLEVGFGGVWVGSAPYLLYIPLDKATDLPAGPAKVLLDGWGYKDTHETLNGFRWGPDGWLYGTQGVFTESAVGRPGAVDSARVKMNAGVWRYHPTRHVFERFAEGTSNPWGFDFNEHGQAFAVVCVIPHFFHIVQGAHYLRQAGAHYNPFVFGDIQPSGDHVHYVGTHWSAGSNRSNSVGGGHAHAGGMVYLGGSWPAEYRNRLFMNNIHGARMNTDILERRGSGFVGRHGPDFLLAHDTWSQMVNMQYGPDGSVWAIDWYDKNQCHSPNSDVHQKTLGRIYRISHENDRFVRVDLQSLSSAELVQLQLHVNDWYVRHASRILQERGADPAVHAALKRILRDNPDVTRRLRALWALHVTGGLGDTDLTALLSDREEYVRSWAIQLLAEDGTVPAAAVRQMSVMARGDKSSVVRLYLAAALQRMPLGERWDVLAGLAGRAEDAGDHNLPLMLWYAAEPMATADMSRALEMALAAKHRNLVPFTVRRINAMGNKDEALRTLATQLARATDTQNRTDLLNGLNQLMRADTTAKPQQRAQ